MQTNIIGIDPGIVHTGCVNLFLDEATRTIDVSYALISGVDVAAVRSWVDDHFKLSAIFIEDYNPGNFSKTDKRMSEAIGRLKAEFVEGDLVKYVDNAGINTLIPTSVLNVFGVAHFPVITHHNDLVSAGKIALLGMLQDKQYALRHLISTVVRNELEGRPWSVIQHA